MSERLSPVRQFARSSGVMALLYAASTGLSFLVGVLLARLLGAAGFGTYALAMTTATMIGLVGEFGLPTLAMRETGAARASGRWSALRGLLHWADRSVLSFSAILIVGTYGVLAATGAAADSNYLAAMLWGVVLVPLVALGKLRSSVLLALDHVGSGQFAVMVLRPLAFFALCALFAWRVGPLSASLAMLAQAGGALAALVTVQLLYRRFRPPELTEAVPTFAVREWLTACVPMGLGEGLRLLQGQLALLLTGWLASTAAAGTYRVADAAMQLATIVASVVASAATPMFSRMFTEGDRAGIERVSILAAAAMLGGLLVLGAPVALAGRWIFPLVFGREFVASAPIFATLWFGLAAVYSLGLTHPIANMTGRHVLSTQSFVMIATLNLTFGALLIPRYAAQGAAMATVSAAFIGTAWAAWRLRRASGFNPTLFNPAAIGIIGDSLADILAMAARAFRMR